MTDILKIEANYKRVCDTFLGVGEDFYSPVDMLENCAQIEKDLPRTVYLSRAHSLQTLQNRWRQTDTDNTYTQGNMDSRIFGETFTKNKTLSNPTLIDRNLELRYFSALKSCGFAFIDKQGRDCGFNVSYCADAPQFFTISMIVNTRLAPEHRRVTIYQSTDNDYYPSLQALSGDACSDGVRLDQSQLKKQLLALDGLTDEVTYFIDDIFQDNGTLEVETANYFSAQGLGINRSNADVFFSRDTTAKNNLLIYQLFCTAAISQLQRLNSADCKSLAAQMQPTLDEINTVLKENTAQLQVGEKGLVYQHDIIYRKILAYLSHAVVSAPYKAALDTMQQKYIYAHRSLWARNSTSLMHSMALSVLTIAALGITVLGTATPLGWALAAAITTTLAIVSVISWSVIAVKAYPFSTSNSTMDVALQEAVLTLHKQGGHSAMLDFMMNNPDTLSKGKNSFFNKSNPSFNRFKQAYEASKNTAQAAEERYTAKSVLSA